MASLTGQTVSSTYDGLLKTDDNDILTNGAKEITDGLGNGTGMTLSTTGNVGISGDLTVNGALIDSNGVSGSSGQILSSTGVGTDWVDLSEVSGVDGTGTANKVTKWLDADTVTDSIITDNGIDIIVAGNISLTGTVDGREVGTDGAKLDGIEAGAQVNTVDSVNGATGIVVLDSDDIAEGLTNLYDKTVTITEGNNITVTGTYPNFEIAAAASTAPVDSVNGQTGVVVLDSDDIAEGSTNLYNQTHTGEVTGSGALTIADDVITYAKLGTEFTTSAAVGASDVDFSTAQIFTKTLSADTTFTFSNVGIGMVKDLIITGSFVPTFPAGSKVVAGTYNGAVSNLIQVVVAASGDYWLSISQAI